MACLSQMELPGNLSRNKIFDIVSFHESESVSTVFPCLHNPFGRERTKTPVPVKKETQVFWLSAPSPGCQTTSTAVPISPSEARKSSVCS